MAYQDHLKLFPCNISTFCTKKSTALFTGILRVIMPALHPEQNNGEYQGLTYSRPGVYGRVNLDLFKIFTLRKPEHADTTPLT